MEDHDVMMTTTIFLVVLVQLSVRRWTFFAQLGTGEELHNLEVKNCTICTHKVAKLWTSKAPWHPWKLERRWPSSRSDTNIFRTCQVKRVKIIRNWNTFKSCILEMCNLCNNAVWPSQTSTDKTYSYVCCPSPVLSLWPPHRWCSFQKMALSINTPLITND